MRSQVSGPCPRSDTTFTTSAAEAMTTASRVRLQWGVRVLEPDVLHLFFQIEPEAVTHTLLQFFNYGYQIGRGATPIVVNQIGVIRGDLHVAAPDSLRSCLFEKPSGRNLAVADEIARNLRLYAQRKTSQKNILEDASGAAHRGRVLDIADATNLRRSFGQALGMAFRELKIHGENDPFFAIFEDTVAIAEAALFDANCTHTFAVSDAHLLDQFINRTAVGAGVTINGAAQVSGNARHGFQAFQPVINAVVHHVLQNGARFDACQQSVACDARAGVSKDGAIEAR